MFKCVEVYISKDEHKQLSTLNAKSGLSVATFISLEENSFSLATNVMIYQLSFK